MMITKRIGNQVEQVERLRLQDTLMGQVDATSAVHAQACHMMRMAKSAEMSFVVSLGIEKMDSEPEPDIAKCSKCGYEASITSFDRETEGDWENGYYDIDLCPKCDDGGCVDDYSMSEERANEWNEWHDRNKG